MRRNATLRARRLATWTLPITLIASGCAATLSRTEQSHIELGAVERAERISALQEPAQPTLRVESRGLSLHIELAEVSHCVAEERLVQARQEYTATVYPRWAWILVALEGGAASTAAAWSTQSESGPLAIAAAWAAGGFAVAAAIDAVVVSGALSSPSARTLTPTQRPASWRVVECGEKALSLKAVVLHGGRADWHGAVDLSGRLTVDVAELAPRRFPYQLPFAEAACEGCLPVAVRLDATAAAGLVIARQDVDDLETWLALHPADADARRVLQARDGLVQAEQRAQRAALEAAKVALAQGDLATAAQAVRRCQAAARLPTPSCDALGRQVDDRFVEQQLAIGRRAIACGAWDEGEAALYRCRLVDRGRPGCAELDLQLQAGRAAERQRLQDKAAAEVAAKDLGLALAVRRSCRSPRSAKCRAALLRCLAVNPAHTECQRLAIRARLLK